MGSREPAHRPNQMKIGELCEASGVGKSTIHNYLRMGLLPPPIKTGLHLHLYSERHLDVLRRIVRLREDHSLSLAEIRRILDTQDSEGNDEQGNGDCIDAPSADEDGYGEQGRHKGRQIIDKATHLFSAYGYENVKISDITDALHMGKGTFYLYFKNKQELLLECFKTLKSLIQPLEDKEPVRNEKDFFLRMRNRWIGFAQAYTSFAGILNLLRTAAYSNDSEVRERARESYDSIIQPIRDDLRAAAMREVIRDVDPELFAHVLFGLAEHMAFRTSLNGEYNVQDNADIALEATRRILRPNNANTSETEVVGELWGSVTDRQGVSTDLRDIRVGGGRTFTASIGDARVAIDLANVESMSLRMGETECTADVITAARSRSSVVVDGGALLSGVTPLGMFTIPLNRVASITLQPARRKGGE